MNPTPTVTIGRCLNARDVWYHKHIRKMHEAYNDNARYWMGNRAISGWQTVGFVADQAAHCATMAAHYARLVNRDTN
jgi:hypothetical protein